MAIKKFKIKEPESTHWYFTIIVKELQFYMKYKYDTARKQVKDPGQRNHLLLEPVLM